jgi:hypothetical protein
MASIGRFQFACMFSKANEGQARVVKKSWPKEWMSEREGVRYVGGKGGAEHRQRYMTCVHLRARDSIYNESNRILPEKDVGDYTIQAFSAAPGYTTRTSFIFAASGRSKESVAMRRV